jgi:hypothetical protein
LGTADDVYGNPVAPLSGGVNGGATGRRGGFLLDAGGNDTYTARTQGVNGGGALQASGFLLDAGGNDTYTATGETPFGARGANGGAFSQSTGALIDIDGDDEYGARDRGANGGSVGGYAGLLADLAGDDSYDATHTGVNGHARPVLPYAAPSTGLLFDGNGTDTYEDREGGTGVDKTVVPKGLVGAQIDHQGQTVGG